MSKKITPKGSAGGEARAKSLSSEDRKEIATKAANTRWAKEKDIPKTDFPGTIPLSEDMSIDCAVVEIDGNPVRLLSERSVTKAIGGKRGGAHWRRIKKEDGANLPVYLSAKNLIPFIDNDLNAALTTPIQYISSSGAIANGIPADVLPKILWVYLEAADQRKLYPSQAHLASKAKILLKALSNVSMIALVDEATGYQAKRAKDALAAILQQYVSDELRKWTSCFPEKFYQEMFRLRGWEWNEKSISGKRPGVVGKYTDDIVYDRLAPGVLAELRRKNPTVSPGKRKHRHYYWLTGEVGHPRLLAHLEGVTLLMRQSKSWDELKQKLDEFYPIHSITELGIEMHVKRRKIGGK
jgi:hypothetical protein